MAYLFTYFIGEQPQGEQIYFSLSKDGLHWKDLHDGKPVICSEVGECGLRDPFLIRKADGSGFVIIATDLCIANGRGWDAAVKTGSKNLAVMESKDLIHWSKPVLVEVSVPEAGCTWAPEAIYDRQQDNYLVFWASMVQLDGDKEPKQRIYAARTKDFHEFTKAQVYLEKDNHVIDSTMVYDDGVYYRFSKDETTKNIKTDTAPDLNKESFTDRPVPNLEAIYGVEGPEIYYLEDQKKWSENDVMLEMAYLVRALTDHLDSPASLSCTSNGTSVVLKPTHEERALKNAFFSFIFRRTFTAFLSSSLKSDAWLISNPAALPINL